MIGSIARRPIARRRVIGAAAGLALATRSARAAETATTHMLAQIVELTGSDADAGTAWRNGAELAVQEINGAGGLLGKLIEIVTYDAQSTAYGARTAMQRALELDPLAVLGPALPDPARGALAVPRSRGTPLILGADTAELNGQPHPATFYTLPSRATMMARLAAWLHSGAKPPRLAVLWSAREPFRAGRDALVRAAREHGIEVAADWVTEGGTPASDLARLLTASPDMLVLLLPEDQCGAAVTEARHRAPRLPLLGDASLISPRTLADAGRAAEGLCAHVLLPPAPAAGSPAGFWARYLDANKQRPEEAALAGYLAVAMVKAALEKAATDQPLAVADAMRGLSSTAQREPMLGDCTWSAEGTPDRPSWIVQIQNGAPRIVTALRGG
jgi:branched-chain amino acid transport system substrate-binding protein